MPKHPPSRLAPCIWPDVLVLASAPFTPTAPINPHSSSLLIRRGLVHRAVSPPRRLNYLLSQHLPASLTKPIAVAVQNWYKRNHSWKPSHPSIDERCVLLNLMQAVWRRY